MNRIPLPFGLRIEPASAWTLGSFALCVAGAGWRAAGADDARLAAMLVVALGTATALLLGATRWIRGRTAFADALQPVLLVALPALVSPGRLGGRVLLLLAIALALALASCDRAALRRRFLEPDADGRALLRQETLGLVLIALFLWLRHIEVPIMILSEGLDTSWAAALGHFLVTGKQAGTDWYFTAGPLAGLNSVIFQPELFWWKLVLWEGLWRLSAAIVLVLACNRIQGLLERAICLLVLLLPTHYFDAFGLATLVAAGLLFLERPERRSAFVEGLALLVLAGVAWTKFTLLVADIGLLGALAVGRWLQQGRAAGLRLLGAGCGALAALWLLSGQGLWNLWPYLRSSSEIAGAYSEAQSLPPGSDSWRTLALVWIALVGLALAMWTWSGAGARARGAVALGLAFVVFCAWKSGFVRASDHAQFFFSFAAPAALLLPAPRLRGLLAGASLCGLRLAAAVVACVGLAKTDWDQRGFLGLCEEAKRAPMRVEQSLDALFDLDGVRLGLEGQLRTQRKRLALPRVVERVGRESIDSLGFRPGVLLLHQLNWTPRPAFQSYITFTPWLQQRNADFLAGPRAPRFLLARIESIDERWAMMDDALALEVACRHYDPVLMEREFLLLERRAAPRPEPARERVLERELRFGETLELPVAPADCAQMLTLELEYTLRGRLARLLDSTPELRLNLRRDDGALLGGRIVAATLHVPMQIDPLIVSSEDWTRWMAGKPLARCVSLAVDGPRGAPWMFKPSFRVRIERLRGLQPPLQHDFVLRDWMDTVFEPRPITDVVPIPGSLVKLGGRDVGLVHAPSRFAWRLAAGHYRLTGRYGMLPDTWEHDNIDGAGFRVALLEGEQARTLLQREFRPDQPIAERAAQQLDLEFALAVPGRLVLATEIGGRDNAACDWCYWSDVRIVRVDAPGADGSNRR